MDGFEKLVDVIKSPISFLVFLIGAFTYIIYCILVHYDGSDKSTLIYLVLSLIVLTIAIFFILSFVLKIDVFGKGYKRIVIRDKDENSKIKKINDQMKKIIDDGKEVTIFSKELSWANDTTVCDALRKKARDKKLTICVPKRNKNIDYLEKKGAFIIEYGEIDNGPKARFTIINMSKSDARVAIGKSGENEHIIDIYPIGNEPVYWMAEDVIRILKSNVNRYNIKTETDSTTQSSE